MIKAFIQNSLGLCLSKRQQHARDLLKARKKLRALNARANRYDELAASGLMSPETYARAILRNSGCVRSQKRVIGNLRATSLPRNDRG